MPVPNGQARTIDTLPPVLRTKIIDMLLADQSSRKVAAYLTQNGHRISFSSVARYKRFDLPKHLETARKLQQINALQGISASNQPSVSEFTNAALMADPLLNRVNAKYSRYDDMIAKAQMANDFGGFSAIDRAETQAIRLHAELTGRLQSAGPTTLVQIVIGQDARENPVERPDDAPGETIEIAPIRE